ncbi:hypothetical protein ACP70R_038041 [Stipagrostis hirtigluma subsp. patula]
MLSGLVKQSECATTFPCRSNLERWADKAFSLNHFLNIIQWHGHVSQVVSSSVPQSAPRGKRVVDIKFLNTHRFKYLVTIGEDGSAVIICGGNFWATRLYI